MLEEEKTDVSVLIKNSDMIWWRQDHLSISQNIKSLLSFLKTLFQKNQSLKTMLIFKDFTYSSSIIHYLLYYCSLPYPTFLAAIDTTLFFGVIIGKKSKAIHLHCQSNQSPRDQFLNIKNLLQTDLFSRIVKSNHISTLVLRDVNDQIVNYMRNKQETPFQFVSLKQIPFAMYDLKETLSMKGSRFSNIRWHLNKFEQANHTISIKSGKHMEKPLLHLIGKWRRHAIHQRCFSFADVHSDIFGAKIIDCIENKSFDNFKKDIIALKLDNIFYRILEIDNQVVSFHLGYRLGFFKDSDVCAHAIGITDLSIPHLSEYAQIDFWRYIEGEKIRYVNDGPSWRKSLEVFKDKFRPIKKQNYFWMTLSLDKLESNTIKNNQD